MSKTLRMILGAVAIAILAWVAYAFVTRPHNMSGVQVGQFHIDGAYARGTGKAGGAFFMLTNTGAADKMVAARAPIGKKTELHTHTENADGVMQMRQIEGGVDVGAGQTVMFKRGGKHVMLMGLQTPLVQGAVVPVTLVFEKAGEITFDVVVDNDRKPSGHGGH